MITKERESELILLAKNENGLKEALDNLSVEDALFVVQNLRGTEENADEVPDYAIDVLLDVVKKHESWFILRSGLAPVPFIKKGRGYIFTEEKLGNTVVEKLLNLGYHTELYLQPMYEEDVLQLLVRDGANSISVNKGCNGIVLDARNFPPPTDTPIIWGESEIQLNAVVSEFITISDVGDDETIAESLRKLAKAFNAQQLYFVSTPENSTVPKIEDSFADGYQHNCFYIFTDMNELRMRYPRRSLIIHRKSGFEIFEAMQGAEFVLNSNSSNILIGNELIELCANEAVNYNRVLTEVKKCLGEGKENFETANTIAEYKDICDEFLAGLTQEGFEYPTECPVKVQDYTAQVLQRIAAPNHVHAYFILSKMRKYPESTQELLTCQLI